MVNSKVLIRAAGPSLTALGVSGALQNRNDAPSLAKIRQQVLELAEAFPLYPERRAKAQAEIRA